MSRYRSIRPLLFFIPVLAFAGFWSCRDAQPYQQGRNLYMAQCSGCHGDEGAGLQSLYPPLAGSEFLRDHADEVPCIIRKGLNTSLKIKGVVYDQPMPALPHLNDVEIANILNYIQHSWGNSGATIQVGQVEAALKNCP